MREIIQRLIEKQDLSEGDINLIIENIERNDFEPLQLTGLLCALEAKGVSSDELFHFVDKLISKANLVKLDEECIDVCGTGGDASSTFNISTACVFIIAGAGVKIAKHGNRAVSGKSGSFDVLQSLGINIDTEVEKLVDCFNKTGICFLFAPKHHPIFKNVAEVRQKLGIKTIFNIMGPLLNPAKVRRQLVGVFDPSITELMAETMKKKGISHGMVVNGGGLDEITITGKTKITELKNGEIKTYDFNPVDYGFEVGVMEDLIANNKEESAEIIMNILKGEKSKKRDIVILNSAAALVISGKAVNFGEGIKIAQEVIDSGRALEKLKEVRKMLM